MVTIIQLCLLFIFCFLMFCETTHKHKDTKFSVFIHPTLAILSLTASYYAYALLLLPYYIQFFVLICVVVGTILLFKRIINKFNKTICRGVHGKR